MFAVMLRRVGLYLIQLIVCEIPFLCGFKPRKAFPLRLTVSVLLYLLGVVLLIWIRSLIPISEFYVLNQLKT